MIDWTAHFDVILNQRGLFLPIILTYWEILTTINVREKFIKVEKAAKQVGLKINEDKTKYMTTARTEREDRIT